MKTILIGLCLVFGIVSCNNNKLRRDLELFAAQEIVLTPSMRQMIEGRDSVLFIPTAKAVRLIVWIDSIACSTCRLDRMYEYDEIINYRKDTNDGFEYIILFSPTYESLDEVMSLLDRNRLKYPVFIDEHQAFPAANPHIPADSRLHTFLLDKNGKVVLVGDPVNNPQLWELYKTTITELIANGGVMPDVEKKD